MANQITVLKQSELCGRMFQVYGTPQDPLFSAVQVAEIINHTQVSKLVNMVDEDERLMGTLFLSGQNRETWMLTENGLYEVLMQSRKPIAKQFKKGVKAILKEIRQTGGYLSTQKEDTPEMIMARALQVAQSTIEKHQRRLELAEATIEEQTAQLREQAPKVEYVDHVLASVNTYTSTQMAKELNLRHAEHLHALLKERGVMYRQSGHWFVTAKYSERGYTKTRTHAYVRSDGSQGTNSITVWTEQGRLFLHDLLTAKA